MTDATLSQDTLFRLTGVGVVQTDMKTGRFVRTNGAFCEMVGYSEAELRGMTYLDLTHPDDRACDAVSFAALGRGERRGGTSLTRYVRKDGGVVWLELHVTVIGEGEGALNLTVVNDVTERKRSEETLRQSEEKYRTLFDSMDEGYILTEVIFDANEEPVDIRYLEANPAAVAMTGTELVGKTTREVDPNFETHWFETYSRVAKTGVGERHEFTAAPLGAIYIFKVGAKEETEVAVVYQDITERKRAEESLRRAAERDAFRVTLNDALSPLSDPLAVQAAAAHVLAEHLQADSVHYAEINEVQTHYRVARDFVRSPAPSLVGTHPMSAFAWLGPRFLEGGRVVIADAQTSPLIPEAERAAVAAIGVGAFVSTPLVKGGRLVATLSAISLSPREWVPEEVEWVGETAERTWAAVEQARAEAALRASEERLQKAVSIETVGVLFFDLDGRMTDVNEAFARMTGYSRDELLGTVHWQVLTAPESMNVTASAARELAERGETAPYEKWMVCKDGSRWWGLFAPKRLSSRTSECVEFIVDITKRKAAEEERERLLGQVRALNETLEQRVLERTEALAASEQRFSQAFYVNPIPACMTTFGRETFVEVNDALLGLTGYAREEVVGKTSRELQMWSSPEDQRRLGEAQRDGKGFRNLELSLRDKDGGVHTVLLSAAVIRLGGDEGYLKMFYDVTEQRRTQEQMHRAI